MDPERKPGFVVCCIASEAQAVAEAVAKCVGDDAYVIISRADDVQFRRLDSVDLQTELTSWEEGRAFSTEAELRWRRTMDNTFSLLLLTEDSGRIPANWQHLGENWTTQLHHKDEENIRVWGDRKVGSSWAEARIPRMLDYPVGEDVKSFRLSWLEYWDGNGAPRLTRLRGIEHATS